MNGKQLLLKNKILLYTSHSILVISIDALRQQYNLIFYAKTNIYPF